MEQKKLSRRSAAVVIVLIGAVLVCMVLSVSAANAPFGQGNVDNAQECAQFLAELGWETDPDAATVQTTLLPDTFDDVYTQYNALQKMQGCDLTPYAGKEITVYTLPVTNYTSCDGDVYATVLTYRGKVIGGDIHSPELGGFMHALK